MGEDKIEQSVHVTDNAQTGDITLIGKIENVIKVIRQPALWQDAVWKFFTQNWIFVLSCLLVLGLVLVIYGRYRNLFLLPALPWLVIWILMVVILWGANLILQKKITRRSLIVCSFALLALLGISGWTALPIVDHPVFPAEKFVIAVATFGEGANYARTNTSQEISDQVYNGLCQELEKRLRSGSTPDPCSFSDESESPVLVYKIGVIPDSETAGWYASRIGADVVIWGQVLKSGQGSTTIRFQIDETLDKAVNPEFPIVMPVTNNFSEVIIREKDYESDPIKIKQAISDQTTYISSFALGLFEYLQRNFPKAVDYFEIAKEITTNSAAFDGCNEQPDNGDLNCKSLALLHFYLGRSYNGKGDFALGQPILLAAREFNPHEPATLISLAIGYGSLGQDEERDKYLDEAMDAIETWRSSHTHNLDAALYDRGVIYQIQKKYPASVIDFTTVTQDNPGYYVAYLNLANSYSEMGEYQKAVQTLQDAIDLSSSSDGNPAWAYLNLAIIHEKFGHPEKARSGYLSALYAAPNSPSMYAAYASFLEKQKEFTGAHAAYNMMVEKAWDKGWAYATRGDYEMRHGLYRDAANSFARAIHDGREKDALLHTKLAQAYARLGDNESAEVEFKNAIQLPDPSYYSFAEYAGFLYLLEDYDQAVEMFQQARALSPNNFSVLFNLGLTYEKLKEPGKATDIYNDILTHADLYSEADVQRAREKLQSLKSTP